MAFFVKITSDGIIWSYCYGRKVTQKGTAIQVSGACAIVAAKESSFRAIDVFSGTMNWPISGSWICAHEVKSTRFGSIDRTIRYPRSIPDSMRGPDPAIAADYAFRSSSSGSFFQKSAVLRSVAEDIYLESLEPMLRTPTFLPRDSALIEEWRNLRPEAYRHASENADFVSASCPPELAATRRILRMEAHRKIDVTKEQFTTTHALGGEAWIAQQSLLGSMRFGRIKQAYYPMGEKDLKVSIHAKNEEMILSVEHALLPGDKTLEEKLQDYLLQDQFARWEETSSLPSIGYEFWGDQEAPKGFSRREGLTGSAASYSSIGINCVISDPARDLLMNRELTLPTPAEAARYCLARAWTAPAREN